MKNKLRKRNNLNRKKVLAALILFFAMFGINIGYSYLETMLLINANVEIDPYLRAKVDTEILGVPMIAYLDDRPSPFVETKISTSYVSSDTNGKGLYLVSSTKNDENPIFYFRGDIDNNNVLFADKCWKMVRTTQNGGIKLLYNGTPNTTIPTTAIQHSEYINLNNNSESPFSYDESTNMWSSTNHDDSSSSTIEFSINSPGKYYFSYNISSESCCDKATVYVDDVQIGQWGGILSGAQDLGTLTSANVIKVIYSKDSSVNTGSDEVKFYIGMKSGEETIDCNNGGANANIGNSNYYSNSSSPAYAGYMRGVNENTSTKKYEYSTLVDDGTIVYGQDVIWDGTIYTLQDVKTGLDKNHHYTCLNNENSCEQVAYVFYVVDGNNIEYITLSNGKDLESAKEEMFSNVYDSNIKRVIDTWYENNLIDYSSYIEDAVWCNNRIITSGSLYSNNSTMYATTFSSVTSLIEEKACPNLRDRFTVSEQSNGNGNLKYPIGLLTESEVRYAGVANSDTNPNSYIISGGQFITMTPSEFGFVRLFFEGKDIIYGISSTVMGGYVEYKRGLYFTEVGTDGKIYVGLSNGYFGVRPVISLKKGIVVSEGEGTSNNPYIIVK